MLDLVLGNLAGAVAADGQTVFWLKFWFSGITDPWVKQCVQHIHDEVGEHEDDHQNAYDRDHRRGFALWIAW